MATGDITDQVRGILDDNAITLDELALFVGQETEFITVLEKVVAEKGYKPIPADLTKDILDLTMAYADDKKYSGEELATMIQVAKTIPKDEWESSGIPTREYYLFAALYDALNITHA